MNNKSLSSVVSDRKILGGLDDGEVLKSSPDSFFSPPDDSLAHSATIVKRNV